MNILYGGGVMKDNIIWVDFTAKNKKNARYKKLLSNLVKKFTGFFSKFKKNIKPQTKTKSAL
jgi:hypothetical protein